MNKALQRTIIKHLKQINKTYDYFSDECLKEWPNYERSGEKCNYCAILKAKRMLGLPKCQDIRDIVPLGEKSGAKRGCYAFHVWFKENFLKVKRYVKI